MKTNLYLIRKLRKSTGFLLKTPSEIYIQYLHQRSGLPWVYSLQWWNPVKECSSTSAKESGGCNAGKNGMNYDEILPSYIGIIS